MDQDKQIKDILKDADLQLTPEQTDRLREAIRAGVLQGVKDGIREYQEGEKNYGLHDK